jgi:hypothetical protein
MDYKIGSKVKWGASKSIDDLYEIVADKEHPYHGYLYPKKDLIICQIGLPVNEIAGFIEVDRQELIALNETAE